MVPVKAVVNGIDVVQKGTGSGCLGEEASGNTAVEKVRTRKFNVQ